MDYATLQTTVADYLNRTDLTSVVPTFINAAIKKLERKYDFPHMAVHTQITYTSGTYVMDNPITNYKKLSSIWVIDSAGKYIPLIRTTTADAISKYPNFTSDVGRPEYIAVASALETTLTPDIEPTLQLMLRPTPDGDYTIDIYAYQYSPALDGTTYTTNWWTENAWEVALYAALVESKPYLFDDQRIQIWSGFLQDALDALDKSDITEETSGSNQVVNPSMGVI